MPNAGLLHSIPDWLIACGVLVLLCLALEAGYRIGLKGRAGRKEGESADLGSVQGAVLGLLGLLLAFTYSFAAGRYDSRRALVVREANAIGTAYLRAGLMPEPGRTEIQAVLRQYVNSRVVPDEVASDPAKLAEAIQRSERVLEKLWPTAARTIEGRVPTPLDAILFPALNDVIDIHTERLAAAEYRVPEVILWLLLVAAMMALALTGLSSGLIGRRNLFFTVPLAVLVTAVVLVINDLDHARRGFIQVSQKSLIQLRDSLQSEGTARPQEIR